MPTAVGGDTTVSAGGGPDHRLFELHSLPGAGLGAVMRFPAQAYAGERCNWVPGVDFKPS